MQCIDYLRLLNNPIEKDLETFATIEEQARKSISSELVTAEFVSQIIVLFHEAYDLNRDVFIKEIFFQNTLALRNDFIFSTGSP